MDAASVFRLISLIPDRSAWVSSGSTFTPEGKSERVALIARLVHWLSPLEPLTPENQQFLGVRTNGGRPVDAEADDIDLPEEIDEQTPLHVPGAGTQIAA